jgi:hypothetical protein
MAFDAIERPDQLPTRGSFTAQWTEREDFDLKLEAKSFDKLELAKDAAAMANTLGGTILVGLTDNGGQIHAEGMTDKDFLALKERLEDALKDQCEPPLSVRLVPVRYGDGTLVAAINIEPFPEAPVACKSAVADAWRFPIRRSSKTHFMSPMEFSVYMNPAVRRSFVLLSRIPLETRIRVHFWPTSKGPTCDTHEGIFKGLSLANNTLTLLITGNSSYNIDVGTITVPLGQVTEVWLGPAYEIMVKGSYIMGPKYAPAF